MFMLVLQECIEQELELNIVLEQVELGVDGLVDGEMQVVEIEGEFDDCFEWCELVVGEDLGAVFVDDWQWLSDLENLYLQVFESEDYVLLAYVVRLSGECDCKMDVMANIVK